MDNLSSVSRLGPPRTVAWSLLGALVIACTLIVLLSLRLRDLSAEYRQLRERTAFLFPGAVVPTFRTATLEGDSITVGESADSASRQVLFVFNTTCPFCRSIIPTWQLIADSLSSEGQARVISISLHGADTTRMYALEHQLRYPVVTFPQRKLERLYRATRIPQTLVLDGSGKVLYAKTGMLDASSTDSIYAAINHGKPQVMQR